MITTSVLTVNCRSRLSPRWPARSKKLAQIVKREGPSFVTAQECYARYRPFLTKRLAPQLRYAASHRGKVLYYNPRRWAIVTGSVRRYSLGDGKHALAARFRHVSEDQHVVVCSAHLLNGKAHRQHRRRELRRLLTFLSADYGREVPILVGADFNDATHHLSDVYSPFGYGDLGYDVERHDRIGWEYSTFHGYRPASRKGVHIDAVLGRRALGRSLRVLIDKPPRYSDHFAVMVKARLQPTARRPEPTDSSDQ